MQWRDMPIDDFELIPMLESDLRKVGVTTLGPLYDLTKRDPDWFDAEDLKDIMGAFDDLFSDNPEWRPNYDAAVQRTLSHEFHSDKVSPELLHGVIGVVTEAGELMDAMKQTLFYGKPLDRTNVIEELGDLEYYLSVIRTELGVSQAEIQQRNEAKLRVRYGDKFTSEAALERDLEVERKTLEG